MVGSQRYAKRAVSNFAQVGSAEIVIKSNLCAYSGDAAKGSGLRHAIKVAQHHNARVTGFLRQGPSALEQRFGLNIPADLIEKLRQHDRDRTVEIAQRFAKIMAAGGLADRSEFVDIDLHSDGSLSEFAHAFDLIVTGVHSDGAHEAHMSAHPDFLALRSGRPVLVVPDGCEADGLADRVIVAWDGKCAATRAIADAMPILADKSSGTLLSIRHTPRGTDRMVANLARHGVTVTARTVDAKGSIAKTILAEGKAIDAKLVVMGAFEHSKFSHDPFWWRHHRANRQSICAGLHGALSRYISKDRSRQCRAASWSS